MTWSSDCSTASPERDEHFVTAHDGADGRARRQVDFLDPAAHHLGIFLIAVGNGLHGFRGAPPQAVDSGDIAAPAHG